MRRTSVWILLGGLAILAGACAGQAPSPAATSAPSGGGSAPTAEPVTEAPAVQPATTNLPAGGRDIASLNVCDLLKQDDVAAALKTSIARPADRTDMGKTTHGCTYYFGSPNSATNDSYIVYVEEASLMEAQLQTLSPQEMSHPVSGYGDVGYLITEMDGAQLHLEFLRKSDAGAEVIGSKADWVLQIGQLLVTKLAQ